MFPTIMKLQLTSIALSIIKGTSTNIDYQINYIASACPTTLRNEATVKDALGNVLRKGTNGWTVMPANPRGPTNKNGLWTSAHEAMAVCFDVEGSKWMQAFSDGVIPEMERDAWVYMLNGDVGEDNTKPHVLNENEAEPGTWIESGPHVMLMPKDITTIAGFPTDPFNAEPYMMWAETDYAHLMIPLENYYEYTSSVEVESLPNIDDMDHSTSEWKIAAFSSAAPRALGQSATVLDADATVLRHGTNGWTCFPSNTKGPSGENGSWASAHDASPICADGEGFIFLEAFLGGTEYIASRGITMYMLHGVTGKDNTNPEVLNESEAEPGNWIESGPHIAYIPKDTSSFENLSTDPFKGEPYTMYAGSTYAHTMVPLNDYYMYHDRKRAGKDPEVVEGKDYLPNSSTKRSQYFFTIASILAVVFM